MTRTYLDFDLQIDALDATTFRARVLNSPAGQGEATFTLPFSDQDLELFVLRIGRPRRGVRRINSPEMNEARTFGSKLYQAVFQGQVRECLVRSLDKTEDQGLRIRLRLPPTLIDLPWEYLYDSSLERFFSHSTSTPIVRYLDLAQSIRPLAVTPPLKILVMIASPNDDEPLDVEAEWQKIESAVAGLKERGLVQLTRLPTATLSSLQKQLRREHYHIFHFIGHGGFDRATQEGVLLLEDENGRHRLVSGNALGALLHDHPALRLAVLNACEGARTARGDPFAGVAQQLVRQGIPAVIAMQFEITDKAAIILAREFYDALADGYPVDGALAEARKSIFTAENDIEWGTPVLYLRAVDGRLFNIAAQPPSSPPPLSTGSPTANTAASETPASASPGAAVYTPRADGIRQKGAWWRQPWLAALTLALLIVLLGIWQRPMIGGWFGLSDNLPTATPTLPATPDEMTPSAAAIVEASPTVTITSTVATATSAPAATESTTATPQSGATPTALAAINPISRTIWLNEGNEALKLGKYEIAKSRFEQILAADPQDSQALLGLGKALGSLADKNNALIALSKAAELAPDDPEVNFALGMLYRDNFDDNQRAIEYVSRAVAASTPARRKEMLLTRALLYQSEGEYADAITDMNEVIAVDRRSDRYVMRAGIYRAWGNEKAAEGDYTAAIDLAPSTGKYYLLRADFYAQLNRVADAVADYETFLRLHDPQENQGLLDKAERYIALHSATPTDEPTPTETPTATPTLAAGAQRTNPIDGAVYVYVPAGKFIMGADDGDDDEKPVHEVTLDAFWIMQNEVTNQQYQKCIAASACTKPANPDWDAAAFWTQYSQHPVTYVSWDQANAYAQWAGGRLPSEAEWEKAARGPDGNLYPWGNDPPNDELLNFNGNIGNTSEVGRYPQGKSYYGALDMAGNVSEWVADWYDERYYQNSPPENPTGPAAGTWHVLRGGNWSSGAQSGAQDVRSFSRYWYSYVGRLDAGLRVVRSSPPGD